MSVAEAVLHQGPIDWLDVDQEALDAAASSRKAGDEETTHTPKISVGLHRPVHDEKKDRYRNQTNSWPSGNGTCKR